MTCCSCVPLPAPLFACRHSPGQSPDRVLPLLNSTGLATGARVWSRPHVKAMAEDVGDEFDVSGPAPAPRSRMRRGPSAAQLVRGGTMDAGGEEDAGEGGVAGWASQRGAMGLNSWPVPASARQAGDSDFAVALELVGTASDLTARTGVGQRGTIGGAGAGPRPGDRGPGIGARGSGPGIGAGRVRRRRPCGRRRRAC